MRNDGDGALTGMTGALLAGCMAVRAKESGWITGKLLFPLPGFFSRAVQALIG
jgi:hypothetical protein